jgi:hypothetical protein
MPSFTGGVILEGPKHIPKRYGLLSVVEPLTPENGHWIEDGVLWEEKFCSDIHSTSERCPIPVSGFTPRILDRDFQTCSASPFSIYASYDCPPIGNVASDAFSIVQQRLEIREGRGVEKTFWTGVSEDGQHINPSLAFGNSECGSAPINLTGSGGPVGVIGSMAVLESALGDCAPGSGIIHANYGVASYLAANYLITEKGDAWYSVTGQRIVIGAGYPGTGPGNIAATPGSTWIFATGPLVLYRSEVFLTPERFKESMDAKLNSVQIYAERVYVVGFSCCVFCIKVLLCP